MTTTAADLAAKLAKFLNRDDPVKVWPCLDSNDDRVYFNLAHELDVQRDGERWVTIEHRSSRCPGCVPCDVCRVVVKGISCRPPAMTEVSWQGTGLSLCNGCGQSDMLPAAELAKAAAKLARDHPWAQEPPF